jgi:hypothetical protein
MRCKGGEIGDDEKMSFDRLEGVKERGGGEMRGREMCQFPRLRPRVQGATARSRESDGGHPKWTTVGCTLPNEKSSDRGTLKL